MAAQTPTPKAFDIAVSVDRRFQTYFTNWVDEHNLDL